MADDAFGADAEQEPIVVTGERDRYHATETTSGTKTVTPIINVPQAVSVVTEDQLRDEAIVSVSDLVRHIPGVSAGQGEGHRDQITLRGNNSTADFFVDGLRDDAQYFRSFYNIDRVEVFKGPNAMIFGRGGGGGVLNRVTKGASAKEDFGNSYVSVNSFGNWSVSVDGNKRLGDDGGVRLNAFYEGLNNHRDAFSGYRLGVNPVLGGEVGPVRLQLGYEYVKDERVVDRGIPSQNGAPLRGFRDIFIGIRGLNETRFDGHALRLRGDADLGSSVKASFGILYGHYKKLYTNAFAATALGGTAAAPTVGIEAYRDPTKRKNFIAQGNLEWSVSTGALEHKILFGGEVTNQNTDNARINGFFNLLALTTASRRATVAFTNPISIPAINFIPGPAGNSNRDVTSSLSQSSLYIQDQVDIGDHLILIAGLRYDRFNLSVRNNFTLIAVKRVDTLWSPRAGLVIKPVRSISIYGSYTKSYLPQAGDQFLTLDASLATLKPETFDNYEIGVKWDIKPTLSFTFAAYQLDRSNTRATGPTPGSIVLTGKQRSKGLEFALVGEVTDDWQVGLGYANTQARVTSTTTAGPTGRKIAQVPRHQASLWTRYDFDARFGAGLGILHQSKSFTTISNAVTLPAYTRVDLAGFFTLNQNLSLQFNIENLFNTRYFPTAHNDNNISTGAPTNIRLTVGFKF